MRATDGEVGSIQQFYFDDRHWTVRYLVADSGDWLTGKQVLISPYSLGALSEADRRIDVDLNRKQIEDSPALETEKPVSRQFEETYHGYYGLPTYWGGPYAWGYNPNVERDRQRWRVHVLGEKPWDAHLRSTKALEGYHIQATDGEIGHVEDFVLDDESWSIRYLVVKTRNWLPGKRVVIAPRWIDRVSWTDSKVFVHVSREVVREAPEYDDALLRNRGYHAGLQGYYERLGHGGDERRFKHRSG